MTGLSLSGPATRRILEREFRDYGKPEFERLAAISNGHLYNLRRTPRCRQRLQNDQKSGDHWRTPLPRATLKMPKECSTSMPLIDHTVGDSGGGAAHLGSASGTGAGPVPLYHSRPSLRQRQ